MGTENPSAQLRRRSDTRGGRGRPGGRFFASWKILELAASLATRCGDAYRKTNDRTSKLFNAAVFERLEVKGGRLRDQHSERQTSTGRPSTTSSTRPSSLSRGAGCQGSLSGARSACCLRAGVKGDGLEPGVP